ncbi:hypothetical protein imdm_700 [gamma proteobacterium IMCC2047]|nr:hypothetical protein imdm_700 [gamma proteobacterium IMCC2047]
MPVLVCHTTEGPGSQAPNNREQGNADQVLAVADNPTTRTRRLTVIPLLQQAHSRNHHG